MDSENPEDDFSAPHRRHGTLRRGPVDKSAAGLSRWIEQFDKTVVEQHAVEKRPARSSKSRRRNAKLPNRGVDPIVSFVAAAIASAGITETRFWNRLEMSQATAYALRNGDTWIAEGESFNRVTLACARALGVQAMALRAKVRAARNKQLKRARLELREHEQLRKRAARAAWLEKRRLEREAKA